MEQRGQLQYPIEHTKESVPRQLFKQSTFVNYHRNIQMNRYFAKETVHIQSRHPPGETDKYGKDNRSSDWTKTQDLPNARLVAAAEVLKVSLNTRVDIFIISTPS
jgi:hypothetical protein